MSYEIVGPFTTHWLMVDGCQVPFLEAAPANGGKINLTLDQRYGLELSVADAETVIPFIADCIAVAMGYTCHPRAGMEPVRSNPFPPVHGVEVGAVARSVPLESLAPEPEENEAGK